MMNRTDRWANPFGDGRAAVRTLDLLEEGRGRFDPE
jgi:hypothetical protein